MLIDYSYSKFPASAFGAPYPLFLTPRAQRRKARKGKREGGKVIVSEIIVNSMNLEVQL